jgi:AcrR family transcriptional regulator
MNATTQSPLPDVNPTPLPPRGSARERLLAAADELFYENGVNTVGIDRIIERAGVAKASLYDCFGSKEELLRAYLEARNATRRARILDRIERYDTPEEKILSVFDLLSENVAQPNYRGCAFVRASADLDSANKVKDTCDRWRGFVLGQFTSLARDAGAMDPELLGRQLVLLYDGASVSAHLDGNRGAPRVARELAAQMLSSACHKKRGPGKR